MITPYKGLSKEIWVLAFAMLVNRIGSMIIAFTSLYLVNELGFSMSQAGVVMGFYGLGSMIGSYLGGWLCDRYDFNKVMRGSLLFGGLMLIPLLFTTNLYLITLTIFLYSLLADAYRPANAVAIKHFSDESTRIRSVTLMRMAMNIGYGIGPALGGLFAIWFGYTFLFAYDGLTSILAFIVVTLMLPSVKRSEEEKLQAKNIDPKSSAFYDLPYLIFLALVVVFGVLFFQIFSSIPLFYSKEHGFSEEFIGYLLGFNGLLVVLFEMPFVNYLQKFNNKNKIIALGCLMLTLTFSIYLLNSPSLFLAGLSMATFTLAEMLAMPIMMNFVLSRPNPERMGQYNAMYSMAFAMSFIIAPNFGLVISDNFGFKIFFISAIILSIILAITFYKRKLS
jgi:predicted MFS family arabinose efflux permease